MIYLYSGTPGSGKSLHATKDIINALKHNRHVISNYGLDLRPWKKKIKARKYFHYIDNTELTPKMLTDFSRENLTLGKENQSLIVIDECAIMFNCRDFGRKDRAEWVTFFQQHRKLGYNIILICQFDRMLDRQIRSFVEYECVHRKLNNAGGVGIFLSMLHITLFMVIEKWYGVKMITNRQTFTVNRKISKAYNSFAIFE